MLKKCYTDVLMLFILLILVERIEEEQYNDGAYEFSESVERVGLGLVY